MQNGEASAGRREFLAQAITLAGGGLLGGRVTAAGAAEEKAPAGVAAAKAKAAKFPRGFQWGAATASYQIEGGWNADGRGESVWDRFSHTPGKIKGGDTGDVACDSYNRWQEDIALVKAMNLKSYRFSIAWPRIQPTGQGPSNQKGLDYYSRLVDGLLKAGIRPFPTLYHWDLPQALEDAGGWPARETADRFAEYAGLVVRALGDRVSDWMILNEPFVFTVLGYGLGIHAPGQQDFMAALRATHVANLAQGDAFRAMRAAFPKLRIGSAFNMAMIEPASASEADRAAAPRWQRFWNSWFVDPALRGRYPEDCAPAPLEVIGVQPGDLERTKAPFDFIGINHYNRMLVSTAAPSLGGLPGGVSGGSEGPKADNGWEIWPKGLYDIVMWVTKEYGRPVLEITENGCACNDGPDATGKVSDTRRTDFYQAYLGELARAITDGADVRGYHAWSLLDNFEWAEGFSQRFGLVHVDFKTGQRTVKESGRWYGGVAAANAL